MSSCDSSARGESDGPYRISRRVVGVAEDTMGTTVEWRPREGKGIKRIGCAPGVRGGKSRHRRVSRRVSGVARDTLGATFKWHPMEGNRVKRPGCAPCARVGNGRHRRVSEGSLAQPEIPWGSLLGSVIDSGAWAHSLGEAILDIGVLWGRIVLHGTG